MQIRLPIMLSVCLILMSLSACSSVIGPALDKFQAAINEVAAFRKMVESEGNKWRDKITEAQSTFTKDVKQVINEDLRDNIDETIENVGIEARCEIEFVETKLLTYLKAVEDALIAKRDEIKKTGKLDGLTPEQIIDDVIKSKGHIAPFVCHVKGTDNVVLKYENQYGESAKFSIEPGKGNIRITGFALKRTKAEKKAYQLFVHGVEPEPRLIEQSEQFLTKSTTYRLFVNLEKLATKIREGDAKVELRFEGENICEFSLNYGPKPLPPERIKNVYVCVKTGSDNKEVGGWHVQLYQREKRVFEDTWGFGQNWDNGAESPEVNDRNRTVDIVLDGNPLRLTSTIEEREGEVRIDWNISQMEVVLTTDRGRTIRFQRNDFTHKSRGDGGSLKTLDVNLAN